MGAHALCRAAALDAANLAWGGVYNSDDFLHGSETLKHRNSIVEIDDRAGGTRPTFQSPYRFSDAQSGVHKGSALLGEHNEEVLSTWLGLSSKQIDELAAAEVIASNKS